MNHALYALAQRGENMDTRETKSYSLNNILGTGLLLSGALLCYLRLAAAIQHATIALPSNGSDALGLLPATGLVVARVLQDLTLSPVSVFSAFLYFLLSCWPLAVVSLGAILLRKNLFAALPPASSWNSDAPSSSGARK
jgi:hypothetical protein